MSFDVFVDSFRDGAPAGIPRDAVRSAFGDFVSEIDSQCWRVRYDEQNFCDLHIGAEPDPKKIFGFMISGPCADQRLWDALVRVLKLGAVVLHFEGRIALVADSSAASHLPKEMLEVFGEPRCISSGEEITDAIEEG